MHHFEIVTKTEFNEGSVAIVLRDTPIRASEIQPNLSGSYGVEFLQGSYRESEAGLTAREAFQAFARHLHKLHAQEVDF